MGYEAGDSVTGYQARDLLSGNEARNLIFGSAARRQANAVEFATKVCISLFDGSKVLVRLTLGMKWREIVYTSEACDLLRVQMYIHR